MDELKELLIPFSLWVGGPAALLGGVGAALGWCRRASTLTAQRSRAFVAAVLTTFPGLSAWCGYWLWLLCRHPDTGDWVKALVLVLILPTLLMCLSSAAGAGLGAYLASRRGALTGILGGAAGAALGAILFFAAWLLLIVRGVPL